MQSKIEWDVTAWLLISLATLNVLDFATTYLALQHIGVTEANPLLVYLMEITGTIWVILWYKILTVGGFLILPYVTIKKFRDRCQEKDVRWAFYFLNVYYLAVVISNTYNIVILLR